jgi:hypothetical protein
MDSGAVRSGAGSRQREGEGRPQTARTKNGMDAELTAPGSATSALSANDNSPSFSAVESSFRSST